MLRRPTEQLRHEVQRQIELLAPLSDASPVTAFLERNPLGGQHHVCFEVPDIDEARAWFDEPNMLFMGDAIVRSGASSRRE